MVPKRESQLQICRSRRGGRGHSSQKDSKRDRPVRRAREAKISMPMWCRDSKEWPNRIHHSSFDAHDSFIEGDERHASFLDPGARTRDLPRAVIGRCGLVFEGGKRGSKTILRPRILPHYLACRSTPEMDFTKYALVSSIHSSCHAKATRARCSAHPAAKCARQVIP